MSKTSVDKGWAVKQGPPPQRKFDFRGSEYAELLNTIVSLKPGEYITVAPSSKFFKKIKDRVWKAKQTRGKNDLCTYMDLAGNMIIAVTANGAADSNQSARKPGQQIENPVADRSPRTEKPDTVTAKPTEQPERIRNMVKSELLAYLRERLPKAGASLIVSEHFVTGGTACQRIYELRGADGFEYVRAAAGKRATIRRVSAAAVEAAPPVRETSKPVSETKPAVAETPRDDDEMEESEDNDIIGVLLLHLDYVGAAESMDNMFPVPRTRTRARELVRNDKRFVLMNAGMRIKRVQK